MAVMNVITPDGHIAFKNQAGKTLNLEHVNGKKVLVVGGGGREHAIADALHRSLHVGKLFCAPGNAGMNRIAECLPIKDNDIEGLLAFAKEEHIDLTVVGPEVPLCEGIVDRFNAEGLRVFGPSKKAAQVESSKDFAKKIMADYQIPTAAYKTFSDYEEALAYVKAGSFPVVLKYDGLAAGKGVVIPENLEEAQEALKDMLLDDKFGHGQVVVEEFLTGPEFSYLCLVCGEEVYPLAVSQDHKRAFEGDKGPNTGGMGAYSPVSLITQEDEEYALEKIMKPMAAAMVKEGCAFKGLLYGGLMKTPDGIKVIEFNCRFGDPETEVILPRLQSDIYEMFSAIVDGFASDDTAVEGLHTHCSELMPEIRWADEQTLGFVLASKGYPGSYEKGYEIKGLEEAAAIEGITIYHMGTRLEDGVFKTNGGRVLMVVASASTVQESKQKALEAISKISCEHLFYRQDIGWRVM